MIVKTISQFLLFYLILSASQLSFSQEKNKLFDEYLSEYILNKNVPSISAGLLKDGKIIWIGTSGFADLENNVTATKYSVYRIASISKPITAVAILQLWEKGLIGLDADIKSYLPNFPAKRWKFTIRQLLNHTSGIRNYKEGEFDSKKFYPSINDAIKVFAYDSLNFEPGTKYEYSTLGYTLLAAVIESVSKMSFENYLIQNIFLPAGMQSTKVDRQHDIILNRVKGYEKDYKRNTVNAPLADLSIKIAGGGLLSTAEDLLLFSNALLQHKIIKATTLRTMTSRSRLKSGKEIDYGLGFSLSFNGDTLVSFSHQGSGTGFISMLIIYPKNNLAAVHLVNVRDRNLGLPAKDIVQIELTNKTVLPAKTLSNELMKIYLNSGIDSTIQKLKEIYTKYLSEYTLNDNEAAYFSDDLLGLNHTMDAIAYLKEIVKLYPKSFRIAVAFGDAHLKDKNEGLALRHYRIAARLNSNDLRVNNLIKTLSGN